MKTPIFTRFILSVMSILFTVVEALLLARIVLVFFNANSTNNFVSFIYKYSDYLVKPFQGTWGTIQILGEFTLDLDALLAWFVYLIIYLLLVEFFKFIGGLFSRE
jgi:uncharacterized protein YggT (Ycf19 family)